MSDRASIERIATSGRSAHGVILADTKFEFGFDRETKELTLIDEVGDARLVAVLAGRRLRGRATRSRRSTSSTCATGSTRAAGTTSRRRPRCPTTWSSATAAKYREAYERISGETFDAYLDRMGVGEVTRSRSRCSSR